MPDGRCFFGEEMLARCQCAVDVRKDNMRTGGFMCEKATFVEIFLRGLGGFVIDMSKILLYLQLIIS